jgi:hypothetical protein
MKQIRHENREFERAPKFEISTTGCRGERVVIQTQAADRDKTGTVFMIMDKGVMKLDPAEVYRIECKEYKIDICFKCRQVPVKSPLMGSECTWQQIELPDKRLLTFQLELAKWDERPHAWFFVGFQAWPEGKHPILKK